MTRKILAMVLLLAMLVSNFAGVTLVHAEEVEEPVIEEKQDEAKEDKQEEVKESAEAEVKEQESVIEKKTPAVKKTATTVKVGTPKFCFCAIFKYKILARSF